MEYVISTDILGFFGNLKFLPQLYPNSIRKLELIGWRWGLNQKLLQAKQLGYKVVSIHGRLFSFRKPILKPRLILLNSLLIPTPDLIKFEKDYEILLHDPATIDVNNPSFSFLWIENDSEGIEGVEKATDAINKLRTQNINSGLVLDLFHFIGPVDRETKYEDKWYKMLEYIKGLKISPISIHLPVGTYLHDSLPLDIITDKMLSDLSEVINNLKVVRMVLENQQSELINQLGINPGMVARIRQRNEYVLERLKKTNLF